MEPPDPLDPGGTALIETDRQVERLLPSTEQPPDGLQTPWPSGRFPERHLRLSDHLGWEQAFGTQEIKPMALPDELQADLFESLCRGGEDSRKDPKDPQLPAPTLLEPAAVFPERLLRAGQVPETAFFLMMDVGRAGPDALKTEFSGPTGEVVIIKITHPKRLVQKADPLEETPSGQEAEAQRGGERGGLAGHLPEVLNVFFQGK